MQAFLGGIVALVLPLFSIPLTPASQPAAAVNAVTPVSEIVQPLTATSTTPEEATTPRIATVDTVSDNDADLRAEIALLGSGISALTALLTERQSAPVPPDFSPFQSQLDALQLAMARGTRIDQLSNVTISSPTFTNLTTGSVSEGSNLYYTAARVGSYISGSTTGTLSNQTDLQTALDAKLPLASWYATTTDALAQGSTNKYWSNTLFDNRLSATTTLPNITTLANLATVGTLTSGIWNASTIGVPYGGTGSTTISGILKGNGTAAIQTAVAGTDYENPLTFSTGLTRTTNTVTLNTGNANSWTALQQFTAGASTTILSVSNGSATTTIQAAATSTFGAGISATSLALSQGLTLGNSSLAVAGTLRWTGSAVEVYDGSGWTSLSPPDTTPSAFSFTDLTGAALWTATSSNILQITEIGRAHV